MTTISKTEQWRNPKRVDFHYINRLIAHADLVENTGKPDTSTQSIGHRPAIVHYVSDNAGDTTDTAPLEIRTRLDDINATFESLTGQQGPRLNYHDIPSQDTYAAAFDLAQGARGAVRGFGNVFFVNCAPRKKQAGVRKKNGGESVYIGILPNGAIISGTGEDAFIHFKDLVKVSQLNIYEANVQTDKTQFRSRDIFPYLAQIVGWYINRPQVNGLWRPGLTIRERDQILFGLNLVQQDKRLEPDHIPDLPNNGAIIQRRDIHHNAKTALRHADIRRAFRHYQDVVVYARGGEAIRAKIARASFDKAPGVTVISAGSSGEWKDAQGQILSPFAEIFTVDGKAIKQLGVTDDILRKGADIHIIPAALFDKAKKKILPNAHHEDTAFARELVNQGLVSGLDYQPLRQALAPRKRVRQSITAKAA